MKKVSWLAIGSALALLWFGIELAYAQFNNLTEREIKGNCVTVTGEEFKFHGNISEKSVLLDEPISQENGFCSVRAETVIAWDIQTSITNNNLYIAYIPFPLVSPHP